MKNKDTGGKPPAAEDKIAALAKRLISTVRNDIYSDAPEVRHQVALVQMIANTLEKEILDRQRDAEAPASADTAATIKADAHSDDHVAQAEFFADEWFAQATDDEVLELARTNWGGEHPANMVAEYMKHLDDGLTRLFAYVQFTSRMTSGGRIGFKCHVDRESAMAWLQKNRPHLHDLLSQKA